MGEAITDSAETQPQAASADGLDCGPATALISDIHGNFDALEAVIADIDRRGVQRIICLGDVVGYGPEPLACLDRVIERCELCLLGNHDFAVIFEPTSFNSVAEQSCFWTRACLDAEPDAEARRRRWQYLGGLKSRQVREGVLLVHASPRRPTNEYIFPEDVITAKAKMRQIFELVGHTCYCGHSHVPGVYTDEPDFYSPSDLGDRYTFAPGEKCVINPGSVGQPRDRDPRAGYALLYRSHVEFIRIEYDIEAVVAKVAAEPALNDFLGTRLRDGR